MPPLYDPNKRDQMAVFLAKTFGLVLYGGYSETPGEP